MTLASFLTPQSIAVVGASPKEDSVGGRIISQLTTSYEGTIYPINPKYDTIQGLPAYPLIGSVDQPVDLILAAAAGSGIPTILRDGAKAGAKAAVVFSSGFAEVGADGTALQDELAQVVAETGIRLLGPNCLGFANFRSGLKATFTRIPFEMGGGNIAVLSQSGSMGIGVASLLHDDGAGVGFWAATGNELDVSTGELAQGLLASADDSPDVVTMVVEGVRTAGDVMAAGRAAAEAGKQVVLLKIGRTARGRDAAISHTAAVSGPYAAFRAACEQSGIVLVETIRELVDVTRGFAAGRRPRGNRVVLVSSSGGSGALMADVTEEAGLDLPTPSAALNARLVEHLPSFGTASNPVDITGNLVNDLRPTAAVLHDIATSEEFDLVAYSTVARTLPEAHRDMLLASKEKTGKPFFALAHQPDVLQRMAARGLTCFSDPTSMVKVLGRLVQAESLQRFLELPKHGATAEAIPSSLPARSGTVAEHAAKQVLTEYGITVPLEVVVDDGDAAATAVDGMTGPAVLKIDASWLPHKSDIGGVVLGVRDAQTARLAYDQLVRTAELHRPDPHAHYRIIVAEQVPSGIELMLGLTREPYLGPVVSLSAGGVTAEIVTESQVSVAPFNHARAEAMVGQLWDGRLVEHPRGLSSKAQAAVVEAILAVQRLALSAPSVVEVDVNPLIITEDDVIAVDALIVQAEVGTP